MEAIADKEHSNEHSISRGPADAGSKRGYSGVTYRNTFRVDKQIILVGVSFFGLHEKFEKVSAPMQISVRVVPSQIYGRMRNGDDKRPTIRSRFVKKGEQVRINFLEMEVIQPGIWYEIEFELNGPETGHMKQAEIKTKLKLEVEGRTLLNFDTFVGSCQMSDFHFLLP